MPIKCFSFDKLKPAGGFINITNGLLDLETFCLRPHDIEIASLVQLPFKYDPDAECPNFHKFLDEIFRGYNELKLLIQEIIWIFIAMAHQVKAYFVRFYIV